jgi:YD repeat-containing protein
VERVTQLWSESPDGEIVTRYGYDLRGNLTGVIDPNGNLTQYYYDDFDQLYRTISPVTGTTDYEYDAAGQLIATTDANGARTARLYDAMGRLTSATSTRGMQSETVTWSHDTGVFGKGRLSTMTDPAGTTTYSYERRGLLRSETRTFPSTTVSYTTSFRYDRDGNRTGFVTGAA